ncbi:MAG: RAD55 family ATPase [Thermoplasmata archaeon]
MSEVVRIPTELREFLELPGPQSLVIRGPPGSGKTTLSIALLEAFRGEKILVTSRVPDRELHREFGWLGADGGRSIQIIDTSEMEESIYNVGRMVRQARETLLAPAEPTDRDSSQFLWLPPPMQEAWARLTPRSPALVVVDSWDALIEGYLGNDGVDEVTVPDRGQIERVLLRRMGKAPAHIVFVLEREEQTALDYLVNGVVVTRREAHSERLRRWVDLVKLRGVRISSASYPFTLEQARFASILPVKPYETLRSGAPDPETDALPGFLWPGSRDFAESLGRLPFGKLTLIELDAEASTDVGDVLSVPIMAHVLGRGGRVLVIPHSSETPEDLLTALNGSVSRERFLKNVRMLIPPGPVPKGKEELWHVVLSLPKPDTTRGERAEDSEALRFLQEGASQESPALIVVSLEGLSAIATGLGTPITPEIAARLPQGFITTVRGRAAHAIVIARKSDAALDVLRTIASTRAEVEVRQGRIFVHGLVPWTSTFVLTDGSREHPYSLLRVV